MRVGGAGPATVAVAVDVQVGRIERIIFQDRFGDWKTPKTVRFSTVDPAALRLPVHLTGVEYILAQFRIIQADILGVGMLMIHQRLRHRRPV